MLISLQIIYFRLSMNPNVLGTKWLAIVILFLTYNALFLLLVLNKYQFFF